MDRSLYEQTRQVAARKTASDLRKGATEIRFEGYATGHVPPNFHLTTARFDSKSLSTSCTKDAATHANRYS